MYILYTIFHKFVEASDKEAGWLNSVEDNIPSIVLEACEYCSLLNLRSVVSKWQPALDELGDGIVLDANCQDRCQDDSKLVDAGNVCGTILLLIRKGSCRWNFSYLEMASIIHEDTNPFNSEI